MKRTTLTMMNDEASAESIPYEDDITPPIEMPVVETTKVNGKFINMDHVLDNYISMKICLPRGESSEVFGKLIKHISMEMAK